MPWKKKRAKELGFPRINIVDLALDWQMRTVVCFNKSALEERLQLNFIKGQVQSLVTAATPQKEIHSSVLIKSSRLFLYMF